MYKKFLRLIMDPGSCVNNRNLFFRSMLKLWFKIVHFKVIKKNTKEIELSPFYKSLNNDGFAYFDYENKEKLDLALSKADELISEFFKNPVDHKNLGSSKSYYFNILKDPYTHEEFIKLASSEDIVNTLSKYFNEIPICDIGLFYSKSNLVEKPKGSQLFHMDYDDEKTIKIYVPINGIGKKYGDLCAINKKSSKIIKKEIKYKFGSKYGYIKDEIINKFETKFHNVELLRGKAFIFDSTKCFHRGSRSSELDRWSLVFNYTSAQSFTAKLSLLPFIRSKKYINSEKLSDFEKILFSR